MYSHTHTHTHTHTCGACTVVAHCLIGRPNSLGGQDRERGGNFAPYDEIWGHIPNPRARASIFSKASKIPSARFTPNVSYSYSGTIGRLGELILRKPHKVRFSCHGTFKIDVLHIEVQLLALSSFDPQNTPQGRLCASTL